MNRFERVFFAQYIHEGDDIVDIFHRHVWVILFGVLGWLFFGALLPAGAFYGLQVLEQRELLWFSPPLWILKTYMVIIWIVIMLKLFDWYNDVWIVTDRGIVDLDWTPLRKNTAFTEYKDITGIESNENSWFDSVLKMGDLVIHKIGTDLKIARLARPSVAVDTIQQMQDRYGKPEDSNTSVNPGMHIYFDGVKQQVKVGKHGHLYTDEPVSPAEEKFLEDTKGKGDTIDLSGETSSENQE